MTVLNYDEIKGMAIAKCKNEIEKKRIKEEASVIEERKWEKYIALAASVLKETEKMALFEGGTIFKSYLIYKFLSRDDYTLFPDNKEEMKIFLNSPLTLFFNIVAPGIRYVSEQMMELSDKILERGAVLGVKTIECAVEPVDGMPAERIVAGEYYSDELKKIGLRKEDIDKEKLMNYLTFDIETYHGI